MPDEVAIKKALQASISKLTQLWQEYPKDLQTEKQIDESESAQRVVKDWIEKLVMVGQALAVPLEGTGQSVAYRVLFEELKAAAELGRPAVEKQMNILIEQMKGDIETLKLKEKSEVRTAGRLMLAAGLTYAGYRFLRYAHAEWAKRQLT